MTDTEKEKIRFLRLEGCSYGGIAERLHLSENTVKSYCQRNGLAGRAQRRMDGCCKCCGKDLRTQPRRKNRRFCSEDCRRAWWKAHPEAGVRSAYYPMICENCGKEYLSYGNQTRKYCSHACYIRARFGAAAHDQGAVCP